MEEDQHHSNIQMDTYVDGFTNMITCISFYLCSMISTTTYISLYCVIQLCTCIVFILLTSKCENYVLTEIRVTKFLDMPEELNIRET